MLICMHSRRPDDDLIFQITPSARSLGALMGPATTVHSDVTTFQTAGTAQMKQTAVRNQCICKVLNFNCPFTLKIVFFILLFCFYFGFCIALL